jgi:hypothetical protein
LNKVYKRLERYYFMRRVLCGVPPD